MISIKMIVLAYGETIVWINRRVTGEHELQNRLKAKENDDDDDENPTEERGFETRTRLFLLEGLLLTYPLSLPQLTA